MKVYKAIVWDTNQDDKGQRVSVLAKNLAEAKKKLEEEHGEGHIFDLHNDEEANRLR